MRELPVRLAALVGANAQDRPCLSAIHDDSGLRVRALSLVFYAAILTFVQRVGRFGTSLPVRS
jgi:hypothetical protein